MQRTTWQLAAIVALVLGSNVLALADGKKSKSKNSDGQEKASESTAGGWQSLLGDKSLSAFEVKAGTATYKLQDDGVLVGTSSPGSPNTYLCTKKEYRDFELEFETKCDEGFNSGVQIRSHFRTDRGGRVVGPQVDIDNGDNNRSSGGYLYDPSIRQLIPKERTKAHAHTKAGAWNKFRIVVEGARIRTWVNGKKVTDETLEADYAKQYDVGIIGLEVFGGPGKVERKVQWRKMRIRELKKKEP